MQLARQRGLRTVNVVRREGAVAAVKADGGDVVLVDGDDLAQRVKQATGGEPVRLGIDAVGGPATDRLARCLAEGGTLVNYGLMSGEPASCRRRPSSSTTSRCAASGWPSGSRGQRASSSALYGQLTQAMARGQLKARIHATYPVQRIQEAVAAAQAGERDGKILVVGQG